MAKIHPTSIWSTEKNTLTIENRLEESDQAPTESVSAKAVANNGLRGVVGGLSETSNHIDRNGRGDAIQKFQPPTESGVEGERSRFRPN